MRARARVRVRGSGLMARAGVEDQTCHEGQGKSGARTCHRVPLPLEPAGLPRRYCRRLVQRLVPPPRPAP